MAATAATRTAARARAGATWRQQQRQDRERRCDTTAAKTIARETRRDKGNTATTTGYCGDGSGEVDSDSGGKSKGRAGTTAGYRSNGDGGNKDDSKSNSGENGERDDNNGGGVSHLSLILIFFVGL